jgi:hypothetical protein
MNLSRRSPLTRKTPLKATTGLQRTQFKRRAPKKRAGHEPKYLAACRGERCFLSFPGCCSYVGDPTVVAAHRNQGKGMGLKVPDVFTIPACHFCHSVYDQSGMDREFKRAAFDWAYTRWSAARDSKLQEAV